jgi:hypothetical protein
VDLSLKIDVVENISREEFDKKYFYPQKPVVIRGIINDQPAGEKWTMEWFKQNHGDIMVDLFDSKKTNYAKTAITEPDLKMRFADYLDLISSNKPTDYRIFLFNIFKIVPELRDDFKCPKIFESALKDMGFVFFGGINSVTRMHQDIDMSNVLLTQFDGKKRVVLFSPDQSDMLYRLPFNTFGLVDIDKPDYEKFPALKYIKGYDVTLERGDAVFMPSGYWHHIVYTTGGFGVSFRRPGTFGKMLQGGVNLAIYMPLDKILTKTLGDTWYNFKQKIAFDRGKQVLQTMRA